jgi:predicted  nucleic acid-binding Zn-ribbon protein
MALLSHSPVRTHSLIYFSRTINSHPHVLHFDLVVYLRHMDEEIEGRFNQLEKRVSDGFVRMEDGFTRIETLIETLANSTAREFASIAEHFETVDEKLASIEGSIEAFSNRVDREVEERHLLAERVLKLEKAA